MKIYYKFKCIFKNTCLNCGSRKIEEMETSYLNGRCCESEYYCSECGELFSYWAYGSYSNELMYMHKRKWKRFLFLFFRIIT